MLNFDRCPVHWGVELVVRVRIFEDRAIASTLLKVIADDNLYDVVLDEREAYTWARLWKGPGAKADRYCTKIHPIRGISCVRVRRGSLHVSAMVSEFTTNTPADVGGIERRCRLDRGIGRSNPFRKQTACAN